jgi:hypothetical protein
MHDNRIVREREKRRKPKRGCASRVYEIASPLKDSN